MLTKRTYAKTHPWIKFDLQTSSFGATTWMLLGEAASKAKHIAGVPLAPEAAHQLYEVFLAKGAMATTAIEGNTLTEDQVLQQVRGKLKLPPSQQYLQQEVQNIIDACMWLLKELHEHGPRAIDADFCCEMNARVLNKLELEDGVQPGQIRRHSVVVGNVYKGAPPEDCKYLLDELCQHINELVAPSGGGEHQAILTALFAHIYMALIHPFGDGNGRTARLLEYYILLRAGLAQPTGHLLSNHYNKTRTLYYRELDRISKSGGETHNFVKYALGGFVDGLKEQIRRIREEQYKVAWINFVHGRFSGMNSPSDHRRRTLLLALSEREDPVRISKLLDMNVEISRLYSGRTPKTLTRDLNELEKMGLLGRLGRSVEAKSDRIKAFLPWRLEDNGVK